MQSIMTAYSPISNNLIDTLIENKRLDDLPKVSFLIRSQINLLIIIRFWIKKKTLELYQQIHYLPNNKKKLLLLWRKPTKVLLSLFNMKYFFYVRLIQPLWEDFKCIVETNLWIVHYFQEFKKSKVNYKRLSSDYT